MYLRCYFFHCYFRVPVSADYSALVSYHATWHTNANCSRCVYVLTYCCVSQINKYDMILFYRTNLLCMQSLMTLRWITFIDLHDVRSERYSDECSAARVSVI